MEVSSWENHLFLWAMASMAMLVITRWYMLWLFCFASSIPPASYTFSLHQHIPQYIQLICFVIDWQNKFDMVYTELYTHLYLINCLSWIASHYNLWNPHIVVSISLSPHYYPHISITLHPIIALPFGTQIWQWRIQVFIDHSPIEVPVQRGFPS